MAHCISAVDFLNLHHALAAIPLFSKLINFYESTLIDNSKCSQPFIHEFMNLMNLIYLIYTNNRYIGCNTSMNSLLQKQSNSVLEHHYAAKLLILLGF